MAYNDRPPIDTGYCPPLFRDAYLRVLGTDIKRSGYGEQDHQD